MVLKLTVAAASPVASTSTPTSESRWERIHALVADSPAGATTLSQSPPATTLDANDMKMYGAVPLTASTNADGGGALFRCRDCGRPVLESAMEEHEVNCQTIRTRKTKRSVSPSLPGTRKRRLSDGSADSTNVTKKSKSTLKFVLGGEKSGAPSSSSNGKLTVVLGGKSMNDKERIEKPSSKGSKVREPVDVDRQCGVINEKGFPCPRSLTCKTHSMGAKRSVPHRSQPYDLLLHEVQKANHPDTFAGKKPVQPRVGPGSENYLAGENPTKKRRSGGDLTMHNVASGVGTSGVGGGSSGGAITGGGGGGGGRKANNKVGEAEESEVEEGEGDMIDSDEEVESVLKGLSKIGRGRPLSRPTDFTAPTYFLSRNIKLARLREVFDGVFVGGSMKGVSSGSI